MLRNRIPTLIFSITLTDFKYTFLDILYLKFNVSLYFVILFVCTFTLSKLPLQVWLLGYSQNRFRIGKVFWMQKYSKETFRCSAFLSLWRGVFYFLELSSSSDEWLQILLLAIIVCLIETVSVNFTCENSA